MFKYTTATVLCPLDERIRLPGGSWLRQAYGIDRFDRVSVTRQQWCAAASGSAIRHRLARQVEQSVALHGSAFVLVIGFPFDSDGPDAEYLGQKRMARIAEFLQGHVEQPVVDLWINNRWKPVISPITRPTQYGRIPDLLTL